MSPYDIGPDTPALRQLQQYASNDMHRSAEAIHSMPSFLYSPLYMVCNVFKIFQTLRKFNVFLTMIYSI